MSDRLALQRLAEQAVVAGGVVILEAVPGSAERKGQGDYVTEVDRRSERTIIELLRAERPDIPVVGEELGGIPADECWLVDPLDGTTNFLHAFPVVGVSVGLIRDGRPVAGAVHAPYEGRTYSASAGHGAHVVDGRGVRSPLRVSRRPVREAIIATGFPFRARERVPRHLEMVKQCLASFEDLRRPGAASLDLAWVAAGVFEGFVELGLSPWDVAAGALLVREAGGLVTDWEGGPDFLSGNILAGSPAVHERLVEIGTAK